MSTWRPRRLNRAARATYEPPATTAPPNSQGAAAGADGARGEPGERQDAGDERREGAGLGEPEPAPGARRSGRPALLLCLGRAPLDGVVPEPPHGAVHLGQRRLPRVDGDGQRGGAEVDVGGAHAVLPAQRSLQLHGAVRAVHPRHVQDAPLIAGLAGERAGEVERAVLVHGQGAVVRAVRLRPGAAGERLDVLVRQGLLVESHEQDSTRDVRLDPVDAVEPQKLLPHLVHAAAALGCPGQQQRQLEAALRHARPPLNGAGAPERSSGPCSTCSRVRSSSSRMCRSSGA